MLEYPSSAKLLETGSHLVSQFFMYPQAFMVPSITVISPTPFALVQPYIITLPPPCYDTVLWLCIRCGSPGQVQVKHAGPHLSQTALWHKSARWHFAKEYEKESDEYWQHILWSDGNEINWFGLDGVQCVWRQPVAVDGNETDLWAWKTMLAGLNWFQNESI